MLNKIHRLRSVGMDNGIATGFGILYVAEEAYPLIPYVRGNEHPLAFGRTPRLLSILFTTFVNTQNADYNGKTRTLTIGKDVRQVARRMGMLTGGCGRQNTVTSIIGYQDITFTSRDGKEIKPIEETNIVQGESWNEKTITFTWEYVRLMSREPKEIPLSAVVGTSGGSLSLDLHKAQPDSENLGILVDEGGPRDQTIRDAAKGGEPCAAHRGIIKNGWIRIHVRVQPFKHPEMPAVRFSASQPH